MMFSYLSVNAFISIYSKMNQIEKKLQNNDESKDNEEGLLI